MSAPSTSREAFLALESALLVEEQRTCALIDLLGRTESRLVEVSNILAATERERAWSAAEKAHMKREMDRTRALRTWRAHRRDARRTA